MEKKKTYGYSVNEEFFSGECLSSEKAIVECVYENEQLEEGSTIWIAEREEVDLLQCLPEANRIIEDMQESMYEEVGEVSEDFLGNADSKATKDLDNILTCAVLGWMYANELIPEFWKAENVIEHIVRKEDIEKAKEHHREETNE